MAAKAHKYQTPGGSESDRIPLPAGELWLSKTNAFQNTALETSDAPARYLPSTHSSQALQTVRDDIWSGIRTGEQVGWLILHLSGQ